eukprot:CAMPEP_0183725554 /NCGR_PEP_ID=MMETSP0737-20130205/20744_1 /TAXON_ID=385413 /ORGANISM="Thalassiosira miniscula, Strain CCMP1093" /LENGTH=167 /DNA_ID=CAMNT_0025956573 /DNA_START=102 /DNA_END=605 /DNA_ORIENTATION=-
MRAVAVLFALTVAVAAAKPNKVKPVKRPGKLLKANDIGGGSNTCYVACDDACGDEGCEVFDGDKTTLGSFSCKCSECGSGYIGEGEKTCDIAGISDLGAEDTSTSCGGEGFDITLLLGREDCTVTGNTVTCPENCVCNQCECGPCSEGEECFDKKGKFGGFQCKAIK